MILLWKIVWCVLNNIWPPIKMTWRIVFNFHWKCYGELRNLCKWRSPNSGRLYYGSQWFCQLFLHTLINRIYFSWDNFLNYGIGIIMVKKGICLFFAWPKFKIFFKRKLFWNYLILFWEFLRFTVNFTVWGIL